MRPLHLKLAPAMCALVWLLGSGVAWANDACPSLSGCSYQAGQGLPGGDSVQRQPASPEVRPPVNLNSCDAGGCLDPNGTRYNGRAAEPDNGVYLDPQGRRCVRSGDRLQCG